MVSIYLLALVGIFTFVPPALAQKPKSDIDYSTTVAKEIQVETQAQQGVPGLVDDIENAIAEAKKNNYDSGGASIAQARKEIGVMLDVLGNNPEYREVQLSLNKIDLVLDEAQMSLMARRAPRAVTQLNQALRFTKTLAASPVLKLTATKVSLRLASRDISGGNYPGAGQWLERAINSLTTLLDNPNVDKKEINSLKNDIIIAHNQVILGKMERKNYLDGLYDRANAATTNALYQYYDMWTMDPNKPWSWY